ncbi:MAG TPA: bifunctional UDP-sugar hydrolase/5'-nucleotidase [Salinarimonas sp.]|jgi:2',3'-cyclic-nucleotide 2'-phosphodiesterase (5'-nucleotidase family)|nr:bifunctional UDP-sugar hydrolase/5'-nucleotidase [Salinarimonas sp.]
MTRSVLRSLAAAAALALSAGLALAQQAKVTFVLTNDVYQMSEEKGRGGLARLAAVVKAEKAKGGTVLFVHAGDTWSPCLLCGFDKGAHMVALFNEFPPDVFVPGNHEFDFGKEVYFQRRAEAKFPFLAANMRDAAGRPLPDHEDRRMIEANGVKIGIMGIVLESTPRVSSSGDLTFLPELDTIRAQAKALRDEGADLVVAVTHTDRAADFRIMEQGLVDILLTGHDHDLRLVYDGKRVMAESGEDAEYVVVVEADVTVATQGGRRTASFHPNFRVVDTASVTPDPAVGAKVKVYEAELSKELDVPLGTTSVELDTRTASVRTRETNFGSLVADAVRASTGADVAIVNGGGIRGNKTYPAGATLTRRDVLTELPFGNATAMTELKGSDLRAALETGFAQIETPSGRFPQISGMTVEVERGRPAGSRVVSVKVNGEPLDEARAYKVGTADFMLRGGDGYVALTRGTPKIAGTDGKLMAGEVMAHIRGLGTVGAVSGDRIVIR